MKRKSRQTIIRQLEEILDWLRVHERNASIVREYAAGEKVVVISLEHGIGEKHVRRIAKAAGLAARELIKSPLPQEKKRKALEAIDAGKTIAEISAETGLNKSTLRVFACRRRKQKTHDAAHRPD